MASQTSPNPPVPSRSVSFHPSRPGSPSPGLNFYNTGVTLITDKPAAGVESIDTKAGLAKCWG